MFDRLFAGEVPGYFGVDTVYHDRQHTLDITLALARLIVGYERQQESGRDSIRRRARSGRRDHRTVPRRRLPAPRAEDAESRNGAEFTRTHVSRGARFIADYLPTVGLGAWVPIATEIVHFTGYEVPFSQIKVSDPRDIKLGHLIGTADMIAQMADRCYLEKCRDRLYAEFVLGGVALPMAVNGGPQVKYASGLDLLRQTPEFVAEVRSKRLDAAVRQARTDISKCCSAAAIPTSRRSSATSNTCARSCAARTGACCAAIRRCSPPSPTR